MSHSENNSLTDKERDRVAGMVFLKQKGASSLNELLEMLTDPNWVVRRSVVEALASLGLVAIKPLCNILLNDRRSEAKLAATVDALVASNGPVEREITYLTEHTIPAVVADIAQVLGRRRDPVSVAALVELAQHADDNVAVMAIEGLGRIGGRAAVEALIKIISEGNFFRTFPAIDVLGRSGDPRAIAPLVQLLNNASYLPEAVRALGRSGEPTAISPLMKLIPTVLDSMIKVLVLSLQDLELRFVEKSGGEAKTIENLIKSCVDVETVRKLTRALENADLLESVAICKLLGTIGSQEATTVLTTILKGEPSLALSAAEALKRIGKNSDSAILQAIKEGSSPRRKVLLPLISKVATAAELGTCLKDTDSEVRAMTCDTLARLGNPAVVKELFPLLGDANLRVVHSATAAIQALGNRETRELAAEGFHSENPIVRRSCLRILAYFGDDTALGPMLKGLEDVDPRVREAAVQGLPFLEDPKAVSALYSTCKSSDARTRSLAMRALSLLPKTSEYTYSILLKGLLDEDAWVRYYSVQSLGRLLKTSAVSDIIKLLDDPAGQVRVSAVEALSHLNVPEAHEALRKAVSSSDVEVKRAGLLGLGIAHCLPDLKLIVAEANSVDASTRLIALSALANFPPQNILGPLSSAASDTDPMVSSAAVDLLAGVRGEEATEVLVELLRNPTHREKTIEAMLTPKEGRLAGILIALESSDDELSLQLVSILTRMKTSDARNALLSAMKLNNTAARKAAASGLATKRDPEALALLREAAELDPSKEVRDICTILYRQ